MSKQGRVTMDIEEQNHNISDPRNGFGITYEYISRPEHIKTVIGLQNVLAQSTAAKNYEIILSETDTHFTIELKHSGFPVIQTTANRGMEGYKDHCAKHFLTMICVKGINNITH